MYKKHGLRERAFNKQPSVNFEQIRQVLRRKKGEVASYANVVDIQQLVEEGEGEVVTDGDEKEK